MLIGYVRVSTSEQNEERQRKALTEQGAEKIYIDKQSGKVKGVVDCRKLLPTQLRTAKTDVLNGIAYNPKERAIYLTGKNWPRIYKVTIFKK